MTTTALQLAPSSPDATLMYMSDTVGIAQLRQNLSLYLRKVAEGERLIVTDRNKPVAELVPPTTGSRLDQLVAEGKVKPPKRPGPFPPPLKMDLDDPNALLRALEETRGYR